MFKRQKPGMIGGSGEYSRLDQHDEEDDHMDQELLLHHPNSVLVANHHGQCNIVPLLSSQQQPSNVSAVPTNNTTSSTSPPHSPRASFSATHATRRFFETKFPIVFRKDIKSTAAASFSSLPAVIIADLQNGNIPDLDHHRKKEEVVAAGGNRGVVGEQGWNIIHRRRFRGKNGIGETRHPANTNAAEHQQQQPHLASRTRSSSSQPSSHIVLDEEIDPSDQVTCSVFVKWQEEEKESELTNKKQYTMTKSHVYEGIKVEDDIDERNFEDPIPVSEEDFNEIVESVRIAIESNMQPTRISQGSSGSYFCRDSSGKIVGVFKPKNEEPYGRLNPKWTKWIHRHLFPCFFGRSCLIPNLGYLSEAAASLIDRKLGTMIVPYTNVIHLSSSSFHYDYLDRKKKNGLPPKIGSFQCFLTNYKDATVFFRDHPLVTSSFEYAENGGSMNGKKSSWGGCLGGPNDQDHMHDEEEEYDYHHLDGSLEDEEEDSDHTHVQQQQQQQHYYPPQPRSTSTSPLNPQQQQQKKPIDNTKQQFKWTRQLQNQFSREFEQLIILDYLIRNTDRGLDNWMIKYCPSSPAAKGVNKKTSTNLNTNNNSSSSSLSADEQPYTNNVNNNINKHHKQQQRGHIHVAAIDNGLAFPYKHPDQWRSYPYGWMAMPDALVNRPFSEATRKQFLTILSDPLWWRDTVREMRSLFEMDDDFDEKMFQKQMAVLKGQGYNIVRTLKDPSAGPVDLVAMQRVVINQEEILIEYDERMLTSRDLHKTQQRRNKQQQQQDTNVDISDALTLPSSASKKSNRLRTQRSTSFDVISTSTFHDDEDELDEEEELDQRVQQLKKLAKQQKQSKRWQDKLKNTMDLGGRGIFGGGSKNKKNNRKKLNQYRAFDSDGDISDYDTEGDSDDSDEEPELKRVTIIIETIQVVKSRTYFTCW